MYAIKSCASEDTKTVFVTGSTFFAMGEHQRDALIVSCEPIIVSDESIIVSVYYKNIKYTSRQSHSTKCTTNSIWELGLFQVISCLFVFFCLFVVVVCFCFFFVFFFFVFLYLCSQIV